MTYRPDLDKAFADLKFEHWNGHEMRLSRKETFFAGAHTEREIDRQRIIEQLFKLGKKELTLEEVVKIVKGE